MNNGISKGGLVTRVREISVSLKITAFFIMIFVFWVH